MLLAVATCASTARWSFFRALTCRRELATLQENAPEASCRLVFRCDVSPIFQSRGPVEDDGDGRGSVLVNSLESLGFLSVFKAYHQIVSVPKDNNDREVRISFSK